MPSAGASLLMAFVVMSLAVIALPSCKKKSRKSIPIGEARVDLDSIVSRGTLRAVTDFNSVNYFVYKGEAIGYQYELLSLYAEHLGVALELTAGYDDDQNAQRLHDGVVDIVATAMTVDTLREDIAYCEPYGRGGVVLVRRGKDGTAAKTGLELLKEDTVAVMSHSEYSRLAVQLDKDNGLELFVQPIDHYDAEQLVGLVDAREVKQTLCFENVAKASRWRYDSLDISLKVMQDKDMAWGVRPGAEALQEDINKWLKTFKKSPKFKQIYRKYVADEHEHRSATSSVKSETYSDAFEDLIKEIARDDTYDGVLISSIVFQESHFNPDARSWAGACGLMQLMPETAKRFGVEDPTDPRQSVEAGYDYLILLDNRMTSYVGNKKERVKFVLAAYNIGLGHVMDAMRLAKKYGRNPSVWDGNVESALLLKSNPTYATDSVVKHGYCRGTETINYVKDVLAREKNYRKMLNER